jgi:hypothetical protein
MSRAGAEREDGNVNESVGESERGTARERVCVWERKERGEFEKVGETCIREKSIPPPPYTDSLIRYLIIESVFTCITVP